MSKQPRKEKFLKPAANHLKAGDQDWKSKCIVCGALPTVHPTELCGPCCFGEADTINGNW